MLAGLRFVSISDWNMQKKVLKQTMKISCMCTFKEVALYHKIPARFNQTLTG